ncbi:hypothetical protein JQ596_33710 [Bradyrhizobium manausense]|uniref:hypothetical protein n=1 Tax=Bradyrhizobium TaxID=374 RepID=UPI001BA78B47|nr:MULTISPECIES: hypothetical protein [Bradyrhizobium]MBR0830476.1 hypothetical protein [Bradyrhizobium manausense]UVO27542.1 hypothetical protein KUF59_34435 [Bradyrhizobium arachidis]
MSDPQKDSPRRYLVDSVGQRVIVGLSLEETIEFETLDSPAARRLSNGRRLWDQRDVGAEERGLRWLELYAKHERAWSRWIAESRARRDWHFRSSS